jgi:imidazolonepropionase-like amidohydrolase
VLAGTDDLPHGNVVAEIRQLIAAGLPPSAALGAASWTARDYLGLPGLEEGAPADVVAYADDPRVDPECLRHPSRVVLAGRVVA